MAEYAGNPRAGFDYEILETIEAGLVLEGQEVKSIKKGHAKIKGSYVRIIEGVPFLIGATIPPYQPKNIRADYEAQRDRRLLMNKKEIDAVLGTSKAHGLTLIPLRLYGKKGKIKLLVGIARGKKKYDKRDTIKKKDIQRSKERGTYEE